MAEENKQDFRFWLDEINNAKKRDKLWVEEGESISSIYRSITPAYKDTPDISKYGTRFNILYSNTELLRSVLFTNFPKPEIKRRWAKKTEKDDRLQSLYRTISEVAERAVVYIADSEDINDKIKSAIKDYLLPGRGVLWVSYEPEIEKTEIQQQTILPDGTMGIQKSVVENLTDQRIKVDYVYWQDFRYSWARTWEDVWWVARRYCLTRKDLVNKFGSIGNKVELTKAKDDLNPKDTDTEYRHESDKLVAEVWEIWDKTEKKVYYITDGLHDKFLKVIDDPLGLEEFFPTPKPLQNIETNDNNSPVPDYRVYKEQASELSIICERISKLITCLKFRLLYPNKLAEKIDNFSNLNDGEGLGIEVADLEMSGGLRNAVFTMPLEELQRVIAGLQEQKQALVEEVYEITGIADIMRGVSTPNETATAQNIKGKFGTFRLQERQQAVQKYIKDLIRIITEIVSEQYTIEKLAEISGINLPTNLEKAQIVFAGQQGQVSKEANDRLTLPTWEEVLHILRNDNLRDYTIDIETSATAFDDSQYEKAAVVEFITNITGMIGNNIQAAMQTPELMGLMRDLTLFGIKQFKVGRTLEGSFENSFNALQQKLQMLQGQAGKEDMKAQADMAKVQTQAQIAMAKIQADMQKENVRLAAMATKDAEQMRFDREKEAFEQELEKEKLEISKGDLERKTHKDVADVENKQEEILIKKQEANRKDYEIVAQEKLTAAKIAAEAAGRDVTASTNIVGDVKPFEI